MPLIHAMKILLAGVMLVLAGCGGGDGGGGGPPAPGLFRLTIFEVDGTTPIESAQVTLFDETNQFFAAVSTNSDGDIAATLPPGIYTARIQAQGFLMSPPKGIAAVPFTIISNGTVTSAISLNSVGDPAILASISGNVDVAGVLVVAEDAVQGTSFSTLSDSNGNYTLFNLTAGDYAVTAFKAGYRANNVNVADVAALDAIADIDLDVIGQTGATVGGHITFLAVSNGVVDVTLLHQGSLNAIPGLSTKNSGSRLYSLAGVPNGEFLAWASFANDGYVMDPDWVNKNGGYPDALLVNVADANVTRDFSITGAISLNSPTNAADLVVPVVIDTLTPIFRWDAYSSTQQYVVEVFDLAGNSIWGGYDFDQSTADNYSFRHPAIGTALQADFNFDASATQALENGRTYLWRVYAFKRNGPSNPWVAISASEEQMGLFRIELP